MLANRVRENERRQALRESRRTWDEAGFNHPILRKGIARRCQCESGTFQPNFRMQDICPTMGRAIWLHFAPSADHSMARLMYIATRDKVCPDMYTISTDKWEHDSSDELDSSLPLI